MRLNTVRRSLVVLLAFHVLVTPNAATLVDEIWLAKQLGASFSIVYITTSAAADATAVLLGSFATLHFARTQEGGDWLG